MYHVLQLIKMVTQAPRSRDVVIHCERVNIVSSCHHSSGELTEQKQLSSERLSFHSLQNLSTDRERAQKWIVKIRRDPEANFVINKNTKICSKHFKPEDFHCGGGNPQAARHTLKKTAVPSLFPWASFSKERTTITSQKAALELGCDLSFSDEDSVSPGPSLNKFCEMDAEDLDYLISIMSIRKLK